MRDLVQSISSAAEAVGTIAVAILAVWGEPIRRRVVGTRLRLGLLDPHGEAINVTPAAATVLPARYYHVVVENMRPHARGQDTKRNLKHAKERRVAGCQAPRSCLMSLIATGVDI